MTNEEETQKQRVFLLVLYKQRCQLKEGNGSAKIQRRVVVEINGGKERGIKRKELRCC